jgi:hypothetical protein
MAKSTQSKSPHKPAKPAPKNAKPAKPVAAAKAVQKVKQYAVDERHDGGNSVKGSKMNRQLLFYDLVTPIAKTRHATWSVVPSDNFSFASGVNSVPLTTTEFNNAAGEFPIVFSTEGEVVLPVAVLGLDKDRSAFVRDNGTWSGTYVPAFVRRYPFVFSASEDGETFTLCIDEGYTGFDRKGKKGERLFDDGGERTGYLDRVLEFVNAYQTEHNRSRLFGSILKDLDLLETSEAKITLPDNSQRSLTGFQVVSREKVKALGADKIVELLGNDALELIFLHLHSLRNFDKLLKRVQEGGGFPAKDAA